MPDTSDSELAGSTFQQPIASLTRFLTAREGHTERVAPRHALQTGWAGWAAGI
ncbi:hypothetical protein FOMPIDRAFT_1041570, partial [Fomitopsis schrenkii]